AAGDAFRRREDSLEVHRAVRRRLGGVVAHDLAEVLPSLERVRGQDPDLDEVPEVAEAVEALEVVGERIVVALPNLPPRVRANGPLEVYVKLDLREGPQRFASFSSQRPDTIDQNSGCGR